MTQVHPSAYQPRPRLSSFALPPQGCNLRPEVIVSDWAAVERFVRSHALGLLTTAIPLSGQATIQASHVPFHFVPPSTPPATAEGSASSASVTGTWDGGELGLLRCHLARANPQAKALAQQGAGEEALVVFSPPAQR